jgi:hypothetical protein
MFKEMASNGQRVLRLRENKDDKSLVLALGTVHGTELRIEVNSAVMGSQTCVYALLEYT